ncbi:MAG: hypothetical protein GY906_17555, partial [bacterium]|nr:hypothetical protein [bacterium]
MRTTSILVALGFLIGCAGGSAQEPNPHVHSAENASTNTSDLDDLPSIGHSSELLRQAEEAVTAQNWKGAATLFSRVWEPGFPVDAFVTNLESSRSNAMEQAARHPELRDAIYMQAFKSSVRTLAACPEPFPPDLPGEYMVHGLLATDSRQNPRAELTAADPWRIAIQLHAVRYGDSDLSPQRAAEIAVDRYGERPDLWTEAVTH